MSVSLLYTTILCLLMTRRSFCQDLAEIEQNAQVEESVGQIVKSLSPAEKSRLYSEHTFMSKAPKSHFCHWPRKIPRKLREKHQIEGPKFSDFLVAYGVPVFGFGNYNFKAMKRACYVIKFMLADNEQIRDEFFRSNVSFVLLAEGEDRENIPNVILPREYGKREVTLGKYGVYPKIIFTNDYVLCSSKSRASKDFMHTVAHAMLEYAILPKFGAITRELRRTFLARRKSGLLKGQYANYGFKEYYAEGVLDFFNRDSVAQNGPRIFSTADNTRDGLMMSDRGLSNVILFVHSCSNNNYVDRCLSIDAAVNERIPRSDCPPPGLGNLLCYDRMTRWCSNLRRLNACTSLNWAGEVARSYCPLSCGVCLPNFDREHGDVIDEICVDNYDVEEPHTGAGVIGTCQDMALRGLCRHSSYYSWARRNCARSCNFC